MARIITIASGKGGVGQTTISANLAIGLATQGFRTCLFDGDLSLADINILFGIYPTYDLRDVVFNNKILEDILIRHHTGIDIIPGSSGDIQMADMEAEKIEHIVRCVSEVAEAYDYVIIDCGSGISKEIVAFCKASSEIILLLTPESTSFIDGYGLLKVLISNNYEGQLWTLFNRMGRVNNAGLLFSKFKKTVQDFLDVKVEPLGSIARDLNVRKALKQQKPCISLYQKTLFSRCIMNITQRLLSGDECASRPFAPTGFWFRSFEALKRHIIGSGIKWKAIRQTVYPQAQQIQEKNDQEYEVSADMHPPVGLAEHRESVSEDFQIVTDDNRNQSELSRMTKDHALCEATLIPLDFEAFVRSR